MFQSGTSILIWALASFLLLLACCLRQNPLPVIHRFLSDLMHHRLLLYHLLGTLSVLMINKIQLWVEPRMSEHTADLTPYIEKFEGNVTPLIQQTFHHPALTYVTTYCYIILFTVLMFASLFIFHHERDKRSLYAVMYAIGLNYLLAIPFFLFTPVEESWVIHSRIHFLIPEVYPHFEEQYRHFSGLNNSFPSLHTSISVTLSLIAWHSRNRLFAYITAGTTGIVLFAILYLGIHWYLDLIAGLALGIVSVALAYRLSEYPLGIRRLSIHTREETATEKISNAG